MYSIRRRVRIRCIGIRLHRVNRMWRWIVFTGAGRRVDVIFVLKTEIQQRQNNSVPLNVTSLFLKLARTSRRTARPQKIHNGKNYTSYHGGRRFSCVAVIKPTAVSCVNRVPFFISLFYFFFFIISGRALHEPYLGGVKTNTRLKRPRMTIRRRRVWPG